MKHVRKFNGKCKISILGGSHSAFSVLYLLLNGPYKINLFDDFKRRSITSNKTKKTKNTVIPKGY